ncbi:Regulatory subunit Dfp1/Him1 central region [Penicillium concentricum]|uniref:Regulatory subunit Dfp1/Him1 central region n=1 Tax=Penicillium concentricum TaxID=293559 RepID=A0A9W9SW46_9EURO|nr:Regulatory subunit Dfp1/Him1 central region [Penicillium concentricum]KAJ5383608.1 Regulatory subunit Dfp1/Him1 central region [Penicillium concentricum]
MATVFVPPSPRTSLTMATRRPLANVPNATNSPRRAELVLKRARPTRVEIPYGQPPPKRQAMENMEYEPRSTTCQTTNTDSKLFARRSNNGNPSAFEKKLVAAREKERQPPVKHVRLEKAPADTMDSIRQWQRHYRKAFPQFVFYFDSIPEDVRRRFNRQVIALGAREEKFFSRVVTHVVTSRAIPPESATPTEPESTTDASNGDSNVQTVNPSLLERNGETHLHASLKTETRRDQVTMDILQRARQMGMKIWALEKLQRMITTINDSDIGAQYEQAARNKAAGGTAANGRGENDLSRVLRQELLNGPSDRDPLTSMEMIIFKGPFVYIHDMNEKTKPVMVREYSRVARRQDGSWPQFRSAPLGKCPFIDEPPSRKEYDRHRLRQLHKEKKAASLRADGTAKTKTAQPVQAPESVATEIAHSQPLAQQEERVSPPIQNEIQKPSVDETHERKSSESFIPPHFPRTGPFYAGHEPAASGVQPSNMTSAIRSQMISSTAAAPGAKAGLSKEVHGLKRKVLEKGTCGFAVGSMAAPQRRGDGFATVPMKNNINPPGKANIPHNEDEAKQSEVAGSKRPREDKDEQKKPERRRDPKPGYCENCRDKFDDFEEHTLTRKHRRFAANSTNWAELDALLAEIQRPLKGDYEYDE